MKNKTEHVAGTTLQEFADEAMAAVAGVLVRHIRAHDCGPDCEILNAMKAGKLLKIQVTHEEVEKMRAFPA